MAGETYEVRKVDVLPALPTFPNTFFMLKSPTSGFFDFYVSNTTGTAYRHTITRDEVLAIIASQLAASQNSFVVSDIAERDAMAPTVTTMAFVMDASADPDVTAGSAQYIYNTVTSTWLMIAEYESQIGPTISWSVITGGHSSTPAQVDDAVAKAHEHPNLASIGRLGINANNLITVDGDVAKIPLAQADW